MCRSCGPHLEEKNTKDGAKAHLAPLGPDSLQPEGDAQLRPLGPPTSEAVVQGPQVSITLKNNASPLKTRNS